MQSGGGSLGDEHFEHCQLQRRSIAVIGSGRRISDRPSSATRAPIWLLGFVGGDTEASGTSRATISSFRVVSRRQWAAPGASVENALAEGVARANKLNAGDRRRLGDEEDADAENDLDHGSEACEHAPAAPDVEKVEVGGATC